MRVQLSDNVTLYSGDCLSVLPRIRAHAVITDPPYGSTACHWDNPLDWGLAWGLLWKCLPDDGVVVLNTAHPFTFRLTGSQIDHHKYNWVWVKNLATNFLHAKRQPLRSHEEVAIFYRKPGRYFPQMTEGHKPTQSARGSSKGVLWHGTNVRNEDGGKTTRFPKSVLEFPVVDPKCRIHPSQKPVELMEYLVRTYTKEGETVVDFAMGSGSTGEACIRSGRKFIGIEKDPEIFEKARSRLRALSAGQSE